MKQLFGILLFMVALTTQAQDSSYNAIIRFNMTDSVENDIAFKRKGTFEAMIYNQRVNSIALQFSIDFFAADGTRKMRSAKGYAREVIISKSNYVVTSTGDFVGSQSQMLSLYGTLIIPGVVDSGYVKNPGSQFYQLSTPCSTEYDWFISKIDATNKISAIIRNIGIREAAAGKLN